MAVWEQLPIDYEQELLKQTLDDPVDMGSYVGHSKTGEIK